VRKWQLLGRQHDSFESRTHFEGVEHLDL
jgi:hypothetical protein